MKGADAGATMRVRTEDKRREIVRIACELFEQQGYERTSMSQISERLGGSKATLYGYFKSKEELLRAVLAHDVNEDVERMMVELLNTDDLRGGLIKLGILYQTRRLSPLPIANIRSVVNQPAGSTLGTEFYEAVLRPAWQQLATYFEKMMDEGRLRRADPWLASMQWKGLTEWDMFERRLLGAIAGPDATEIELAATTAADAFLKLYGVEGDRAGGPGDGPVGETQRR